MTILDRNAGTFTSTTGFTVARSTGVYGTGTKVAVVVFSNTVVNTPSGWAQRASSVVDLGLYAFDRDAAGEASFAFTNSAGTGCWFAWELSAGSTFLNAQASQTGTSNTTQQSPAYTPTAGDRHLLAVVGGVGSGAARTVTAFSDSFTEWADQQAAAQDWPFAGAADRDVTANGSTAYSTTATFSATTQTARGGILLTYAALAADATPPSVPAGLAVGTVTSTTAALSWSASTDNVGVAGYEVQVTKV